MAIRLTAGELRKYLEQFDDATPVLTWQNDRYYPAHVDSSVDVRFEKKHRGYAWITTPGAWTDTVRAILVS